MPAWGAAVPGGERGRFGQRRQRNPARGRRASISAKGQGENRTSAELAQPWDGRDPCPWSFLFCYTGKSLCGGFCARKTFCGREAVCRQRGSSLPGKHLPASALQHFSCMNVNRHPSGALFRARVLLCRPSAQPYLFADEAAGRDRQGQAAATPACSGRGNSTLIPPAAAKGRGSRPLSCPILVFWGARSLPLLPPAWHRAGGSWTFTPAPKSRPPHTCSYLTPSVARDFNFGCICGCLYIQVLCIF